MGNLVGVTPVLTGVAGLAVGLALFVNLPTAWWMPSEKAPLSYLSQATLQTLDEEKKKFPATDLWSGAGTVVMAVRRPG